MPVIGGLILGELAGRVGRRAVPYVVQARWREGRLGQPAPPMPRSGRVPKPNPVASAAGAHAGALAVRSLRAAAMRGTRRSLGRSGPGGRALRL